MSDSELVEALAALEQGKRCQVCVALEQMSREARDAVTAALAGTIGEKTLADILTQNGYPTGRRAINRHRREAHSRG